MVGTYKSLSNLILYSSQRIEIAASSFQLLGNLNETREFEDLVQSSTMFQFILSHGIFAGMYSLTIEQVDPSIIGGVVRASTNIDKLQTNQNMCVFFSSFIC